MKTLKWIKLIGISCIVFGSLGIINNISSLFTPQWIIDTWPAISPVRLKWIDRLAYLGIFVNIIYLMGGIFFLRKKPFSLLLMYAALTISLLYVVIPLLFFKPFDDFIFVVIGPIIDLCLFIGVYRIRKYYYDSPNEIIKLFGEYTLSPRFLKLFTFLGLLCISIPISILGLWIYASNTGTDQADRVEIFNNHIPDYLHGSSNYLNLIFCALAIILSSICLNSSGKSYELLNKIILSLGFLLLLLNLFQLM